MKHTPGPWAPVEHGKFSLVKANNKSIAAMTPQRKEHRANARLMAAAPTLADAIVNALSEFREKECNCDGEYIDGQAVGYPCYFHRVEQELKDALEKAGVAS